MKETAIFYPIPVIAIKNKVVLVTALFYYAAGFGQTKNVLRVTISDKNTYQTIHNFAASDAWAAQYVGLWPDTKKNKVADWLFSTELNIDGSPKGIGLSTWRFNIGAGSAEQANDSGIKDPWRRTEGFLRSDGAYDWGKQAGQRWFLKAAQNRGVNQFIAFVNSPPLQITKNRKAHSDKGLSSNLPEENYPAYANFLADVLCHFEEKEGVTFNYISPFNEPQWEWKGGQEGSPWNNDELADATKVIDSVFRFRKVTAKIEITEAGAIDYLTGEKDKFRNRSNQITTFFDAASEHFIGKLNTLAPKIVGHSYFTTWPVEKLQRERERIAEKLQMYPSLEYGMSEYCILENNEEIRGKGKDLGMNTALYVARVIHADLTIANASAWQWWLAMSPYDFKDGLVYHDKKVDDGKVYDSKLLWTLGNFSRFIRPGATRISAIYMDARKTETLKKGVLISAYRNMDKSVVVVAINQGEKDIDLKLEGNFIASSKVQRYVTDSRQNLKNSPVKFWEDHQLRLEKRSVTTYVFPKR